jgi:hypothetical protein
MRHKIRITAHYWHPYLLFVVVVFTGVALPLSNGFDMVWFPATEQELTSRLDSKELCFFTQLSTKVEWHVLYPERHQVLSSACDNKTSTTGSKSNCPYISTKIQCGRFKVPGKGAFSEPFKYGNNKTCDLSISETLSYWTSSWRGLSGRAKVDPSDSLYHILRSLGIKSIRLVGDSVAEQMSGFLRLLLRSPHQDSFYISHSHTRYLPCGLKKGSAAYPGMICCTRNSCTPEKQADFIVQKADKEMSLSPPGTTLLLMHVYGVHIWNVTEDLSVVEGVAAGLIAAGKKALASGNILLALEAPAQHFHDKKDGSYDHTAKYHYDQDGMCCASLPLYPPGQEHLDAGNFRNRHMLATLDRVDPLWRKYVGWIPFYDITQRVKWNVERSMDCTHGKFSAFLFDPMLMAMEKEVKRLSLARNISSA